MVSVQTTAGMVEAYACGEGPAVLLFMDALGLRTHLNDVCDEIASWGYRVLAPNTYHRFADVAAVQQAISEGGFPQVSGWMNAQTAKQMVSDGGDFVDWFAADSVALVGFCMGVKHALRVGGAYPDRVSAVVGFHGANLVTEAADSPHRSLATITAPVLMAHAKNDRWNSAESIAIFEQAMADAGVTGDSQIYDANHGFMLPDIPTFDAAARTRGMTALRQLLDSVSTS